MIVWRRQGFWKSTEGFFWDQDTDVNFTVHDENLTFHRSKDGGWHLIGSSSDGSVENEGFAIGEMIIGMIADTEKRPGAVEIIRKKGENGGACNRYLGK